MLKAESEPLNGMVLLVAEKMFVSMIPDSQVIEIITEQFPDIKMHCAKAKIFKGFECISNYARELINKRAYPEFKKFVSFINQLYHHSNNKVKMGIDNILLYNIGTYIDVCAEPHEVRELLPLRMRDLLYKQFGSCAL